MESPNTWRGFSRVSKMNVRQNKLGKMKYIQIVKLGIKKEWNWSDPKGKKYWWVQNELNRQINSKMHNSRKTLHKKWSFPLRISSAMWPKPQFPAVLATFTEETLNWKLHFLCNEKKFSLALLHARNRGWETGALPGTPPNSSKMERFPKIVNSKSC